MPGELIPISGVIGIVLIVLLLQWYKVRHRELVNRERLALIEKGVYEFPGDTGKVDYGKYLFLSLLLISFGLALIIGSIIEKDSHMILAGILFGLPGAGTLLFYYMQTRKEKGQSMKKSDGPRP